MEAALRLSGRSRAAREPRLSSRALGRCRGRARRARRPEAPSGERYVSPGRLAQVHVGLGERTEALDRLEEAVAERAADVAWLSVRPVFADLHGEPRFGALLKQISVAAPSHDLITNH